MFRLFIQMSIYKYSPHIPLLLNRNNSLSEWTEQTARQRIVSNVKGHEETSPSTKQWVQITHYLDTSCNGLTLIVLPLRMFEVRFGSIYKYKQKMAEIISRWNYTWVRIAMSMFAERAHSILLQSNKA
jgi:hypothetical protein